MANCDANLLEFQLQTQLNPNEGHLHAVSIDFTLRFQLTLPANMMKSIWNLKNIRYIQIDRFAICAFNFRFSNSRVRVFVCRMQRTGQIFYVICIANQKLTIKWVKASSFVKFTDQPSKQATTMTGRGTKRRGRPPKTQTLDRQSAKYNHSAMRKPKYVTDSQFSTPSASRASSPQGSDSSRHRGRPSTSRKTSTRGGRGRKRGSTNASTRKSECLWFDQFFLTISMSVDCCIPLAVL